MRKHKATTFESHLVTYTVFHTIDTSHLCRIYVTICWHSCCTVYILDCVCFTYTIVTCLSCMLRQERTMGVCLGSCTHFDPMLNVWTKTNGMKYGQCVCTTSNKCAQLVLAGAWDHICYISMWYAGCGNILSRCKTTNNVNAKPQHKTITNQTLGNMQLNRSDVKKPWTNVARCLFFAYSVHVCIWTISLHISHVRGFRYNVCSPEQFWTARWATQDTAPAPNKKVGGVAPLVNFRRADVGWRTKPLRARKGVTWAGPKRRVKVPMLLSTLFAFVSVFHCDTIERWCFLF